MSSRDEIRQDTERLPSMPYWLHKWTGIKPELHQVSEKKKAPERRGRKHAVGYGAIFNVVFSFSSLSIGLFVFVSFSCSG